MLKIKTSFNFAGVAQRLQQFEARAQDVLVTKLKRVAREQVKRAKLVNPPKGYYDDTGDLSSSKGAMVFVDGIEVYNYYTLTDQGQQGIEEGKKLAREVGSQTTGVALVVTAGMFYARYVEDKGKDVISGTSEWLVADIKSALS